MLQAVLGTWKIPHQLLPSKNHPLPGIGIQVAEVVAGDTGVPGLGAEHAKSFELLPSCTASCMRVLYQQYHLEDSVKYWNMCWSVWNASSCVIESNGWEKEMQKWSE